MDTSSTFNTESRRLFTSSAGEGNDNGDTATGHAQTEAWPAYFRSEGFAEDLDDSYAAR